MRAPVVYESMYGNTHVVADNDAHAPHVKAASRRMAGQAVGKRPAR